MSVTSTPHMDFPDRSTVEFDIKLTEKKCPQNLATLINFRKKRMKKNQTSGT